MTPTISVMMSVYNAERYVAQAVQSILAQTYKDFEFLIVDDGSTDRSLVILQGFAAKDSRIRLISRPNTGLVVALNEMLDLAQGEFIARMDADDISIAERFKLQLEFLSSNPNCLCVGSSTQWIDPDGDLIRRHTPPLEHEAIDNAHLTSLEGVIFHPSALIRTKSLRSINGYDEKLFGAEDVDVWLKLAERGRLSNMEEVLLYYRFHFFKVGSLHRDRQNESAFTAVQNACSRRGIENIAVTPGPVHFSHIQEWTTWAWWALHDRNFATARKYAKSVLRAQPLKLSSWRLFYCCIRGF